MEEKHGIPVDQPPTSQAPPAAYPTQPPPAAYPTQPPPAYQAQPQMAGQQVPGYPVQQQLGYPGQAQPGYIIQQQPGYPATQQVVITMPPANRINNNLVLAIISTLLCCPICGIIGIIYAAQVDSAFYRGEVARAENYSANAKKWSIAAIICGCAWIVIVIIYYIIVITVISY